MDYNFNLEKGCVYFIKHIGIKGVKIGYSGNPNPRKRFESFLTFAPNGGELIGFITCHKAKELESILHNKYSVYRMSREWFDISIDDCKREIEFYSNKEDIEMRNAFQLEWCDRIDHKKKKSYTNYEKFEILYFKQKIKDPKKISDLLEISIQMVYRYINRNSL